ncbi:hypothetical protein JCM14469_29060 [Desulfatiferula olefinivorans]
MSAPLSSALPNPTWSKKAFSFLVRCRQEFWGKHNEQVLAWLFRQGLQNRFAHDMLLGWNRFARIRPAASWGIDESPETPGSLIIPPGIIVPDFEGQALRSLFVWDLERSGLRPYSAVLGSAVHPLIRGENSSRIAVVFNLIHGLFIHQEFPEALTVIVPHPDQTIVPESVLRRLETASDFLIVPDPFVQTHAEGVALWAAPHPRAGIITCPDQHALRDHLSKIL